ncbi:MAG TPA: MFS transporter [Bacteroidales bacterium]|nr:MFS transporter [Bacteroidales bacterium]HPO66630.1 MFS transporter [Bacteroidales bacterium]
MIKDDKRVINAWCSYDIANSAYNLVITATIFPIYYQESSARFFQDGIVKVGGFTTTNTVLYDLTVSLAYLMVVILSPLLSGIADYGGYRRRFMRMFTYLGGLACLLLYGFTGQNIGYGLSMAAIAVIGYAGSLVFYNSFLPIIATPERHDRVSARGFAWGYLGSVLLLIVLLLFITFHAYLGIQDALQSVRLSFIVVGIWWIGVAHIAFHYLVEPQQPYPFRKEILFKGYKELLQVWSLLKHQSTLKRFLLAFFLLSVGVQTILLVATLFGKAEIGVSGNELIATIIIIQFLGLGGAMLFGEVSTRKGNKFSLLVMIGLWMLVCIAAWRITTSVEFFILAAMVGMVMGGIQSQARSTYAKLIPSEKDAALYFSFYEMTEKTAIVLGMFLFGLMEHYAGSMRLSALMLGGFFALAWLVIAFMRLPHVVRNDDNHSRFK